MILALNAGSSSLKFGVYHRTTEGAPLATFAHGGVSRIDDAAPVAEVSFTGRPPVSVAVGEPGHHGALGVVLDVVEREMAGAEVAMVGHRVVHGGSLRHHAVIDQPVERAIEEAAPLAPIHNPAALDVIRLARRRLGGSVPMVAVLDTAFFADLDARTRHYPIPWEIARRHGLYRLGFHGIAHQAMLTAAARLLGKPEAQTSLVTLQLGSGCSAGLIHEGRAVDTSMGMTPLEGLMMGTRSGSIDPALVPLIAEREGTSVTDVMGMLNEASGLLGVSGVSSDMRDVLAAADAGDERSELAAAMFAYRIRKQVGAYLAAGARVDAVVFGGGIGERAATVRQTICAGLDHIGIRLDDEANRLHDGGDADVTQPDSPVRVLVVEVDELLTIAESTHTLVG